MIDTFYIFSASEAPATWNKFSAGTGAPTTIKDEAPPTWNKFSAGTGAPTTIKEDPRMTIPKNNAPTAKKDEFGMTYPGKE